MDAINPCRRTPPAILLILLVGGMVYGNTFQVPFALDDFQEIIRNPDIKTPGYFLGSPQGYQDYPARFITYLSFAFNYRLGGLEVSGYHVVNLLVHLASAVLAYALLRLTFRTPFFLRHRQCLADHGLRVTDHGFIPLFAALLFVVHPVQTQAVTYIIQRATSLAAMFYLLALVLYVMARLNLERHGTQNAGREGQRDQDQDGLVGNTFVKWRSIALLAAAVVAALLAMKSKETAFTLPLAVVLYEGFFFRDSWKRRLLFLLPLLATLPVVPLNVLASARANAEAIVDINQVTLMQGTLSRLDYLYTQCRVIVTYLRLLVLPANQNLDYDYPVYTSFFTPQVFWSFLLLAGLFAVALYLLWLTRTSPCDPDGAYLAGTGSAAGVSSPQPPAPELRLIAFGILWFFLTLSVESSVIPIADVIAEHRLYLPGFGAAVLFAAGFVLASKRLPSRGGTLCCVLIAVIILSGLAVATVQRNHVWGDSIRLWQDVVAKSPGKARPYNNLGTALNDAGRFQEAIEVLNRAIAIDPFHPDAYSNLGRSYLFNDQNRSAVQVLQTAIRIDPQFEDAYINLAAAFNQLREFPATVTLIESHRGLLKGRVEAHYHLGVAYAFLGQREAARRELTLVSKADEALAADLMRLLK